MTPFKQRAIVTALIGLGLLVVGFFGLRTAAAFREFRGHRPPPPSFNNEQPETDVQLIRDWMTIPFIGRMYHVPPQVIFAALEIPVNGNKEKNLKQLNDEYFPDVDGFVETKVKETVLKNMPLPMPTEPPVPTMPGVPTP
jgi:hypothetical protein